MTTYDKSLFPTKEYAQLKKMLVKLRPLTVLQMVEDIATADEDKDDIEEYCRSAFFEGLKGDDKNDESS